jgi:hypothetical protein
MRCPPTHHLVYGTLHDYLSGEELMDTDDDRARQELSRMMVGKRNMPGRSFCPAWTFASP